MMTNTRRYALVPLALLLAGSVVSVLSAHEMGGGTAESRTNLFEVCQGDAWGFVDHTGRVVVAPRYERCGPFSEGLAPVRLHGKWGYIDQRGHSVIDRQYREARQFSEGLAPVQFWTQDRSLAPSNWAYVDRTGSVVASNFVGALPFSDGLGVVMSGGVWAAVDRLGRIAFRQTTNVSLSPFSEGLAVFLTQRRTNGQYSSGFVDKHGRTVIGPERGCFFRDFSEGLACVLDITDGQLWNPKVGYIDTQGRSAIPLKFGACGAFKEGLAPASTSVHWGYIDKRGYFVIPPEFVQVSEFSEGLAAVLRFQKWGYINRAGTFVIGPLEGILRADPFEHGLARIWVAGEPDQKQERGRERRTRESTAKMGYIDRTGRYVWPPAR